MTKNIRTKTIKQAVQFAASSRDLYNLIMDSKKYAAFTGSSANISRRVGGAISAYGGWIKGKNLKLIPGRLIVQTWRGADWPKGHFSTATFLFTKTKKGAKLTFRQAGVPVEKYADINKGWRTQYWAKMKEALRNNAKK